MKAKQGDSILISVENGIQTLTLNRPKKKNALEPEMYVRLAEILEESSKNDAIIMTVITGAGDFFSSGNDIKATLSSGGGADALEQGVGKYKNFVDALIVYPKLLVAVVNGPAIGIAATTLPLFDMVYASEKAYFQVPFTALGLVAEGCSTYTFPRVMGNSKAGDMLYMGYKMSAAEAKQYRLVSDVYKDGCMDEIWNYLKNVSTVSKESITIIKNTIQKWNKEMLLKINSTEAEALKMRFFSEDMFDRMMAAMSKRKSKL